MTLDLLSVNEVIKRTGLGRTTLWRLRQDGKFIGEVRLNEHNVAWPSYVIDEWLKAHPRPA